MGVKGGLKHKKRQDRDPKRKEFIIIDQKKNMFNT